MSADVPGLGSLPAPMAASACILVAAASTFPSPFSSFCSMLPALPSSLPHCRQNYSIFSPFSSFPSPPSNLLLHYAASASSLPSLFSAVSIVHLLPEGILVLPSSCSAISVLLCCSRILLFRSRLLLFLLLLGRPTSFCAPPWPRALGHSCQPPRWGWRRPVLPPPSSRVCRSLLLRPLGLRRTCR